MDKDPVIKAQQRFYQGATIKYMLAQNAYRALNATNRSIPNLKQLYKALELSGYEWDGKYWSKVIKS